MAYIGRSLQAGSFRQLDDISSSFNGSTTAFTMQVNSTNVSMGDVNQIQLSLGGVIQKPGTDFTISGSTLTFTTAPAANTSFFAILLGSDNGGTVTPTDGSVTGDKLASTVTTSSNITTTGTTSLDGAVTINDSSADVDFRVETNGNANMFVVDGGNDAVIFNGSTSNFASGSQAVQVYNSGLSFTSGYGIQGGANTDRASVNLTSGASGHIVFKTNNSEVARFTTDGLAIGGTGAANTLDDYEEGTWTPTLGDSSGNNFTLNSSYSSHGYYTKVGRIVHAHCYIVSSAIGSASGSCLLGGLPFTNINNNRAFTAGTISAINNANLGDGKSASYYLRPNQTSGFMFNHNNADGGNTMSCAEISSNGEFMMTIIYTT